MVRTIRQHFQHRLRLILAGIGIAWLLLPVAAALAPADEGRGSRVIAVALFALATGIVVGAMITLLRVRCPRCQGSLTHLGAEVTFPIGRSRAKCCPHCGVSLDEPL